MKSLRQISNIRVAWYSTPTSPQTSPDKLNLQEKKFLAILGATEMVGAVALTYGMLKYVQIEGLAVCIYVIPFSMVVQGLDTLNKATNLRNKKD